jgi:hypothetical protein
LLKSISKKDAVEAGFEIGVSLNFSISTRTPASPTCDAPVRIPSDARALRGSAFKRTRTPEHQNVPQE